MGFTQLPRPARRGATHPFSILCREAVSELLHGVVWLLQARRARLRHSRDEKLMAQLREVLQKMTQPQVGEPPGHLARQPVQPDAGTST